MCASSERMRESSELWSDANVIDGFKGHREAAQVGRDLEGQVTVAADADFWV